MSLDWIPRAPKDEKKHFHFGDEKYLGTEAPCTMYEKSAKCSTTHKLDFLRDRQDCF